MGDHGQISRMMRSRWQFLTSEYTAKYQRLWHHLYTAKSQRQRPVKLRLGHLLHSWQAGANPNSLGSIHFGELVAEQLLQPRLSNWLGYSKSSCGMGNGARRQVCGMLGVART